MSREAVQVFISYAHEDAALRRKHDQHLAPLVREGEIAPWHDREIAAGEERRAPSGESRSLPLASRGPMV